MVARVARNGPFQEYDLIPSSPMAIFFSFGINVEINSVRMYYARMAEWLRRWT